MDRNYKYLELKYKVFVFLHYLLLAKLLYLVRITLLPYFPKNKSNVDVLELLGNDVGKYDLRLLKVYTVIKALNYF